MAILYIIGKNYSFNRYYIFELFEYLCKNSIVEKQRLKEDP